MDLELIQYIILIIQVLIIIYLIFKTNKIEKFDINNDIGQTYKADIDAMRNMGSLSNYLFNNNTSFDLINQNVNMNNLSIKENISGKINLQAFNGIIVLWSNNTIPPGWAICDGANGTPDLRSRFVVGAINNDPTAKYGVGNYSGEEEVLLTPDTMPNHDHESGASKITYMIATYNYGENVSFSQSDGGLFYRAIATDFTGGNNKHNNMPPYYALYYIMKLGNVTSPTNSSSSSTTTA